MAKFFNREGFISQKILKSMAMHGLRLAADLSPWLQEPRIVTQQQGKGFFTAKSGIFASKKTGIKMQWESKNEEAILKALDDMPEVEWFNTQCIKFTYAGTEDEYDYTPDIVVRMSRNQIVIIEAKPAEFVCAQSNYRKYLAGKQLCGKNDWHFMILSSREGTIEDMASYDVSPIVKKDFLKKIEERPHGKYGGLLISEVKQFIESRDLKNMRPIIAIALKNDLTFQTNKDGKLTRCTKLEPACSWSRIIM
jgi:hypothetical protein